MFSLRRLSAFSLLTAPSKVLILNSFSFNLGFYMLLPYLADHLYQLGLTSWHVGIIIGLRVLSQQGLFLIGGTLGDRFGYKPLILSGCAVRIVGFIMLGMGETFSLLILGAFLTGFAGALFTPSSDAYLASEYPDARVRNQVFSLKKMAGETGMLLGPLVGLTLLSWSFMSVGLTAAALFAALLVLQWCYLPAQAINTESEGESADFVFWRQWGSMLRKPVFVKFILAASVNSILFHQLYLSVPHQIHVMTGNESILTLVFMTTSILGVFCQLPISRWVVAAFGDARSMGLGMSLMGCAYLLLQWHYEPMPALPFVLYAALFSFGTMLSFPVMYSYIPNFAPRREMASYYGLYSCVGGFMAFMGNWVTGWYLSLDTFSIVTLTSGLALLGAVSGLSLFAIVSTHQRKEKAMAH